jgi:hypothetical protein
VLAVPLAVLALAGLAACSTPIGSTADRAGASPKDMVACRRRADEIYTRQNPADVYHSDMLAGGQRDAPFGGLGQPGSPTDGLSSRYTRETLLDDCLNGLSGSADAPASAETSGDPQPRP